MQVLLNIEFNCYRMCICVDLTLIRLKLLHIIKKKKRTRKKPDSIRFGIASFLLFATIAINMFVESIWYGI